VDKSKYTVESALSYLSGIHGVKVKNALITVKANANIGLKTWGVIDFLSNHLSYHVFNENIRL
jgi:hypothetical protein